jgi:hypothetical protein
MNKPVLYFRGGVLGPWGIWPAVTVGENQKRYKNNALYHKNGGGRGIRTPGAREGSTVFKTAAFNHSAIPPATGISDTALGFASPLLRMPRLGKM